MTSTPVFDTAPEGAVQLGLVSASASTPEPSAATATLQMLDAQADASAGSCCGGGCCN